MYFIQVNKFNFNEFNNLMYLNIFKIVNGTIFSTYALTEFLSLTLYLNKEFHLFEIFKMR